MSDDWKKFNVTSYDQRGGITAGEVNIGTPQRDLNAASPAELEAMLDKLAEHKSKEINIVIQNGDAEARNLGYQILQFLEAQGFTVSPSIGEGIFSKPIPPLSLQEKDENHVALLIGSNNPNWPNLK